MKTLIISLKIFLFFTILTGIVYPLVVTGIVQVVFPHKANGNLIVEAGKTVGSELIGQQFDSTIYFMGRPSVTLYNPLPSGGSNYGLTNAKLKNLVEERKQQFIRFNQLDSLTEVPSEMLFASASGLDPHISPKAALLQVERVANARGFNADQKQQLQKLVLEFTEEPQFLCLGEKRVNIFLLNLEIDNIQ
ncbi:MAG: potassium-transporting ATPase subunit C [Bacteroidetes bacterium GWF2_42_66]|nr:MAG: potassium-transporting ATPase subunit C [Bacteroidetes bacterium GWA2_42_15]OFY00132.1 MAG: potassium-transporting ATPase subunit C [Bacteroidetes bacterium GWE2_42_39]OFY40274.1 MAG: potassium-transporting ATPase subunit C [Bacteroidetes bacterium GWF2_42_66]HBL73747.1 potassium-transporting ATPase subunit KdpC [Prolixibacteraceae bacterium]HCR91210.1 potassium-transporting ATPase subunit KdpC [Prolixibacteraceae bacterium]